jgi:hypothetical protein
MNWRKVVPHTKRTNIEAMQIVLKAQNERVRLYETF